MKNLELKKSILYIVLLGLFVFVNTCGAQSKKTDKTVQPMLRGFMVPAPENMDLQVIEDVKNWGANLIRIQIFPVKWAVEKKQDFWEVLPAYLDMLQEKVDYAASLGVKVVIDLHEPPILKDGNRTDVPYWGTDEFWNREDLLPNLIRMWKLIAERFKNPKYNDVIYAYDIYNEPQHNSGIPYIWREQMAQPILDTIRNIDKDVWIIYEVGPWGNTNGYITYNGKPLLPLIDDKVIYSVHYYTPQESFTHIGLTQFDRPEEYTREQTLEILNKVYPGVLDDNGQVWNKEALRMTLQPVIDFQKKYNVPIYVGEFSTIAWLPVESIVNWLRDVIDLFEELQWPWTYHAFREWAGWCLEHPEGVEAFWFKNQPTPQPITRQTERAKVLKEALKKNQ